jgi:hypothetical protein
VMAQFNLRPPRRRVNHVSSGDISQENAGVKSPPNIA